ncbi:MAG: hypothetical protein ACXIUL_00025 [Wenzhouxiangella sp.]
MTKDLRARPQAEQTSVTIDPGQLHRHAVAETMRLIALADETRRSVPAS